MFYVTFHIKKKREYTIRIFVNVYQYTERYLNIYNKFTIQFNFFTPVINTLKGFYLN